MMLIQIFCGQKLPTIQARRRIFTKKSPKRESKFYSIFLIKNLYRANNTPTS